MENGHGLPHARGEPFDQFERQEVWRLAENAVTSEQDRVVLRETFVYDLPPRAILRRHPDLFTDAHAIYTTKRNLTGLGSFLVIALVGLVLASLVNLFLQNSVFDFQISAAGVLIFAGLTAYDTQRLKFTYYNLGGDQRSMAVATNYGALQLYLDFINLFLFILRMMSSRR